MEFYMTATTSVNSKKPRPPFPNQKQTPPGIEKNISPRPIFEAKEYKAANKLLNKVALITGGDSGIGRAVAVIYAKEGAKIAITYLAEEKEDAIDTKEYIENMGGSCFLIEGNLIEESFCFSAVNQVISEYGTIDILVSNAAHQMRKKNLEEISSEEWDKTFRTNIYAYFYLAKAAIKHMKPGSVIIATSSETAHLAPKELPDYSATKGAINTFTKSLAQMLIDKGIRVNAIAPGPVWTPLNISDEGNSEEKIKFFGEKQPIKRPAQPEEIAPAYVFLASNADSSYITGAIIAETGGIPIN